VLAGFSVFFESVFVGLWASCLYISVFVTAAYA
jgi:hypothetical protein